MQLSNNASADVLRSARDEQKIEVTIEDGAGGVSIRYSTWTDGLGWCGQKTIRLDCDQLEDLQRALTAARHRITRGRAEVGESVEPAQVIRFPSVA